MAIKNNRTIIQIPKTNSLLIVSLIVIPLWGIVMFLVLLPFSNTDAVTLFNACLLLSIFFIPSFLIMYFGIHTIKEKKTFTGRRKQQKITDRTAIFWGVTYFLAGFGMFSLFWAALIEVFVCQNIQSTTCDVLKIPALPFYVFDKFLRLN